MLVEEKGTPLTIEEDESKQPEIPRECGDDPIPDNPSIDEEQKQPQAPDSTTTNKEIPSADPSIY